MGQREEEGGASNSRSAFVVILETQFSFSYNHLIIETEDFPTPSLSALYRVTKESGDAFDMIRCEAIPFQQEWAHFDVIAVKLFVLSIKGGRNEVHRLFSIHLGPSGKSARWWIHSDRSAGRGLPLVEPNPLTFLPPMIPTVSVWTTYSKL